MIKTWALLGATLNKLLHPLRGAVPLGASIRLSVYGPSGARIKGGWAELQIPLSRGAKKKVVRRLQARPTTKEKFLLSFTRNAKTGVPASWSLRGWVRCARAGSHRCNL